MVSWSDNSSTDIKNQLVMQYWSFVQDLLLKITGRSDFSSILVTSYSYGSIIVSSTISPAPSENPNTVYDSVTSNVTSLSNSNFKVISASSTLNGYTSSSSSSSVNIGLIVGVSIAGLLLGS
jgi:hypothetical protein